MLDKIFALFAKERIPDQVQATSSNKVCGLTFEINKEGAVDIICEWPDFDLENSESIKDIAHNYANLLAALNNGLLDKDIMDTMKNYDSTNPFNSLFYKNVLSSLSEVKKNYSSSYLKKQPLISPLNVFKTN